MDRDFVGYGLKPPRIEWPNGARLAISMCVNFEEGSELSPWFGDDYQQPFVSGDSSSRPKPGIRAFAAESQWEYGARSGVWRMLRIFEEQGVKATFFVCAMALESCPPLGPEIVAKGHDIVGHGWRWVPQWHMERNEEQAYIHRAVESVQKMTGRKMLGWFSRGGPSMNTREILKEEGFLYDSEAFNDDLPYYVKVKGEPWLEIPYAFDSNDGANNSWHNSEDFYQYLKDAFDILYAEGATDPKMLSIGLHTRRTGRPGRAAGLVRFIQYANSHPKVWFAGRDDIARWWWGKYPPQG